MQSIGVITVTPPSGIFASIVIWGVSGGGNWQSGASGILAVAPYYNDRITLTMCTEGFEN